MSKELRKAAEEALDMLARYTKEVPLGNQPHMAAADALIVLSNLNQALSKPEAEQVGYYAADKDGNIIWSEYCVSEEPVFPTDEDDESCQSIPFYGRPSNVRRLSKDMIINCISAGGVLNTSRVPMDELMDFANAIQDKCNIPKTDKEGV